MMLVTLSLGTILCVAVSEATTGSTPSWDILEHTTTIPQRAPGSCYHEGRWYGDGQQISRSVNGDCVYGSHCTAGSITYYDGIYCFYPKTDATTIPTTPQTSIPKGCVYNGVYYTSYTTIRRSSPWPGCVETLVCKDYNQVSTVRGDGCRTPPSSTTTTTEAFTSGWDLSKICVENGRIYREGEVILRRMLWPGCTESQKCLSGRLEHIMTGCTTTTVPTF